MNKQILCFIFPCLVYLFPPLTATAQVVAIPDHRLESAIMLALGRSDWAKPLTAAELATLTHLTANFGIEDLTGLEGATSLESLDLDSNYISDISALAGLTNLKVLDLDSNYISDISALAGLTHLTTLYLEDNTISDISALAGLTNLKMLYLDSNTISDISALAGLTHLTTLYLDGNTISDISALAGLTHLTTLYLEDNTISDISALAGLTHLTALYLRSNTISDISALAGLTNLKVLYLENNTISDISALAGLTHLTTLYLDGNTISDISALVGLTNLKMLYLGLNSVSDLSPLVANPGLGMGDTVRVWKNPLSSLSIHTHIPTLQARGVMIEAGPNHVHLNVGEPYTVRLIYFLPGRREPRPNIDAEMDALIKGVQRDYARDMERHGFGRKTFTFETDATGKAVVHHVNGQFTATYYEGYTHHKVLEEIGDDLSGRNIYLIVVDSGYLINGAPGLATGRVAFINSLGADLATYDYLVSHELRHTFGLGHDFRVDTRGFAPEISKCTAEFLDVHPFFNVPRQKQLSAKEATIRMFPPSIAAPPNTIRLRFEVTAPDGLHQARLLTPEVRLARRRAGGFLACKRLNGTSSTVEFVTTALTPQNKSVFLRIIDVHGNSSWSQSYPIDVTSLLPPPEVVSIPDANLAAEVRERLGLAPGDTLTSHTMLELWYLSPSNPYTDLTGLKHAINLTLLHLDGSSVSDLSSLAGLTNLRLLNLNNSSVSDLSSLAGLTNLTTLWLYNTSVSDLSPLAGLTNLTTLNLQGSSVSDLSSLAGLTNLTALNLYNTSVSDLSSLAGLTNLTALNLYNTSVSDLSSLAGLTNLTTLYLLNTSVSDLSPLAGLTNLTELWLDYTSVSDLSPLAGLTNLTTLYLDNTSVSDLSPLAGLTNLTTLRLPANPTNQSSLVGGKKLNLTELILQGSSVSDLSSLAGLTNLRYLRLDGTSVSDLSPLAELTYLIRLNLYNTSVLDLSPLAGLTYLTELRLDNTSVSDLSSLAGLTNLTSLYLSVNNLSDISALAGLTNLTSLYLSVNNLSDISALAGLTNLRSLTLDGNSVSDLSSLAGLTNLTSLYLDNTSVSDLSSLAGLTNLTTLDLRNTSVSDLSSLAGLTNLTTLDLQGTSVSDLSPLAGLTNLTSLYPGYTSVSDLSPLAGLTNVTTLDLRNTSVSDLSSLAGLTNLTTLYLYNTSVSDLSPLVANTGLGSGDYINLYNSLLSYLSIHTHIPTLQSRGVTVRFDDQVYSALLKISGNNQKGTSSAPLSQPLVVEAQDENGAVLPKISVVFRVTAGGGKLSVNRTMTKLNGRAESTLTLGPNLGTNTVEVSATGIKGTATFHAIADTLPTEYLWSIPAGMSLIHVPLQVTTVDDVPRTITSIADLYDTLGGATTVNLLTTHDPTTQGWHSYLGDSSRGTIADPILTDGKGIIAIMNDSVSLRLNGDPLGANGRSSITLHPGPNLVGVPLRDSRIARVSDLFALKGITGNVSGIVTANDRLIKVVKHADDTGNIPITGGQSFILIAQKAATVAIFGEGWYNRSPTLAGPSIAIRGVKITDTTPVLALRGSIVFPTDGWGRGPHLQMGKPNRGWGIPGHGILSDLPHHLQPGLGASFRAKVKNLSTGRAVSSERRSAFTTVIGDEGVDYRLTFVDIETGRAAKIGDILEISSQSTHPFVGVQPLQYTVTVEDVKRGWIQLPALVAYEIPTETELLANYPNPFNPETWIPYRLAEDAFVTLTIYDTAGRVVRTLDVGHRIAAVYESRSKAIYWDGRNDLGERVASGVYFYHLSAGDYSATRRMVILK